MLLVLRCRGGEIRHEDAVAFEENPHQIITNAATFGWDLPALVRNKLFFLDAHLSPDVVKASSTCWACSPCSKRKPSSFMRSASSSTESTFC
jgi:hypothetical protein